MDEGLQADVEVMAAEGGVCKPEGLQGVWDSYPSTASSGSGCEK